MIIPLKTRFLDLDEEAFFLFCQDVREAQVEREADGTIIIMDPTGADSSNLNAEVTTEVAIWNRETRQGKTFDSNGGFTLPNKAVRSPDTAWVALDRWLALPPDDRKRFAHISPDFVVEIRSENDDTDRLHDKMAEYQANGVRLGWLIDPQTQQVWIYRADGSISHVPDFDTPLSGEDVLTGFELRLWELWEG
ncbi:MAG: Uma2 family endonuclease [Bacteroidia bacterium]